MELKVTKEEPGWTYPKAIVPPNETQEHAKERATIDKNNQETMKIGESLGWSQEKTTEHVNRGNMLRYLPKSASAEKPGETPAAAGTRLATNMFDGAMMERRYDTDPSFAKEVQARASRDGWTPTGPSAAALTTAAAPVAPDITAPSEPLLGRSIASPSGTTTPAVKQAFIR